MEPSVYSGSHEEYEKPNLSKHTNSDATVIISTCRACVCGSDLWFFRGISEHDHGSAVGHEAIGIVEEVGSDVHNVSVGDFVIVPFTHGCGHCPACLAGFDGDCYNREPGNNAYQCEYVRYANANWGLVKIPGQSADCSDEMLNNFLTLSDVMATGYHAAFTAEVKPGDTVVVMGDGAVGLCGVISAKLRGAKRIIAMSRHADRQKLALEFGATDIVEERGDEAIAKVMEITDNHGADAVLECVGTEQSVDTATKVGRPGAIVGRVGIPQNPKMDTNALFRRNIGCEAGLRQLLRTIATDYYKQFWTVKINPGKVFTHASS